MVRKGTHGDEGVVLFPSLLAHLPVFLSDHMHEWFGEGVPHVLLLVLILLCCCCCCRNARTRGEWVLWQGAGCCAAGAAGKEEGTTKVSSFLSFPCWSSCRGEGGPAKTPQWGLESITWAFCHAPTLRPMNHHHHHHLVV